MEGKVLVKGEGRRRGVLFVVDFFFFTLEGAGQKINVKHERAHCLTQASLDLVTFKVKIPH